MRAPRTSRRPASPCASWSTSTASCRRRPSRSNTPDLCGDHQRRTAARGVPMTEPIRVLIVDDIAETRDHISKLLSFETDMNVVGTAASGPEALALAPQLTPDVVLMDINMPGMDGIATTE